MVHQDRRNHHTSPASLEDVFNWLLPADLAFARHANAVVDARVLAAQAVAVWGWASGRTLAARLAAATPAVRRSFPDAAPLTTRQGLCQALATCGDDLVAQLSTQIADRLRGLSGCFRTAGRPTFAVDGSKFTAPRTAANQAAFAAAGSTDAAYATKADAAKAQTVQVLLTIFWHVGSGLPACWRLAPSNSGERTIAAGMLDQLPTDARIVGDAEYVGYPLWSAILESGRHFVVRVGANVTLLEKLDVRRGKTPGIVHYWPQDARRAGRPPIPLRLVPMKTKRRTIWLLTNEFDLDPRRVKELYAARWGVEVFFRTVKQNCGKAKLVCRTPDHVRVELHWTLLGIWASLFVARLCFRARGQRLERLSPRQVLDAFAAALLMAACDGGTLPSLNLSDCLKADESKRTTSKASRRYPRKKQRRACGKPKLRTATNDEVQAAKAIL